VVVKPASRFAARVLRIGHQTVADGPHAAMRYRISTKAKVNIKLTRENPSRCMRSKILGRPRVIARLFLA
jgi:hypothetical protein